MFLQYATPSALLTLYSLHLQELGLSPLLTAVCCSTQALATVLIALFVGQAADRWFSAERCLAVCAFAAGGVLWALSCLTDPAVILPLTLLFWMLVNPILLLGTTISFTHLPDPERQFGPVRMWGTVGWMVPGWLLMLGSWLLPGDGATRCTDLFRIGTLFAFLLGVYALTIPHTPPRRLVFLHAGVRDRRPAPLAALALLRSRSFAVYCGCTLGVCLTFPFTTQATPLLLQKLGIPLVWMSPTLTLSQVTEVTTLALLPMLLLHLGLRGTMLLGLGAWAVVMLALAVGQPVELVLASLPGNGLFVTCFLVAGQVFVNRHATGDLRASVQSLLTFVNGVGQLLGHLLVGYLRWQNDGEVPQVFSVGAAITCCLLLVFLAGFRERSGEPEPAPRLAVAAGPATPAGCAAGPGNTPRAGESCG
jgi:hypothetical protein